MAAQVNWTALGVAVLGGVVVGVSVGLGAGFAARALGWSTDIAGPLTGALVTVLVMASYSRRSKCNPDSADARST